MDALTIVLPFSDLPFFRGMAERLAQLPMAAKIIVAGRAPMAKKQKKIQAVPGDAASGAFAGAVLGEIGTPYFMMTAQDSDIRLETHAAARFLEAAHITGAGIVYADYWDSAEGRGGGVHELNDYQPGSFRDDFDFGPLVLMSKKAAAKALNKYGAAAELEYGGLYDLRLKMSMDAPLFHLREPLYEALKTERNMGPGRGHFSYVEICNELRQKEMEAIFTNYLKMAGAYLAPKVEVPVSRPEDFPVEASVVIPVRNRAATIGDALVSALRQETAFSFNVIVVDNHSTDGTSEIVRRKAAEDGRLHLIQPSRLDLNIGGCWNEAVFSALCGRWAVQLDSDDLYSGPDALQKIVAMLQSGSCAMAVGSYTVVDEQLKEIPPGLIDHREWTADNGHNNLLRVNGIGAPRAYSTAVLRRTGFLNVSYGEDYAMALQLSRRYRVGRIYENLYYCRRWKGNTDASLTIEQKNRNDAFKDSIRTMEFAARIKQNKKGKSG